MLGKVFWTSLCVLLAISFGIAFAENLADNDGNGVPDIYDKILKSLQTGSRR